MVNILGRNYDETTTTYLELSNKNITSEMLPDLFNKINKLYILTYLYLNNNQITTYPRKIFKRLTKLTHLYLYNNRENNISLRYIKLSKEEKLKEKISKIKIFIENIARSPDRSINWFFDTESLKRLELSFKMTTKRRPLRIIIDEIEFYLS
jgi:hypothetical protein